MWFDFQSPAVISYAPQSQSDDPIGPLMALGAYYEDSSARVAKLARLWRNQSNEQLSAIVPPGAYYEDSTARRSPKYSARSGSDGAELSALPPPAPVGALGVPWESMSSRAYIEYAPRNETIDVLPPLEIPVAEAGSWLDSSASAYAYSSPVVIGQADTWPALQGGAPPSQGNWLDSVARKPSQARRRLLISVDVAHLSAFVPGPVTYTGVPRGQTAAKVTSRARTRTRRG